MTVDVEERLRAYAITLDRATEARSDSEPIVVRRAGGGDRRPRARMVIACACAIAVAAVVIVTVSAGRPDHHSLTAVDTIDLDTTVVTAPARSSAPSVTPSIVSDDSSTTPAPIATLGAPPVIDTLAIGDSVMQGASNDLIDNGVTVEAQANLQAVGAIETLSADLDAYDITGAVVIQVGTNGSVTQAEYDQLAAMLRAFPHAYFLTVKAPKPWIDLNNAIIRALPLTHPNVTVVDWEAFGQTIESQLSKSDGYIHLVTATAQRDYANLILGALDKPLIDPSIDMTVSTTDGHSQTVAAPLLVGLRLDTAAEKLAEIGLHAAPITYQDFPFGSVNVNRVISQSVTVGQPVSVDSAIALVVGRELPPETQPPSNTS